MQNKWNMKIRSYDKKWRVAPTDLPTFETVFPTTLGFASFVQSVAYSYYGPPLQTAIKSPDLATWLYDMFMGRYGETILRYEQVLWSKKFKALLSNHLVSLIVNNAWIKVLPTEPITADLLGETIVSSSTGDTSVDTTSNATTSGNTNSTSNTTDAGTTNAAVANSTEMIQATEFNPGGDYVTEKQFGSNNVTMDTTSSGTASDTHSSTTDMTSNRVVNGSQTKTSFVENIMRLEGTDLTMKVDRFLDHFAYLFMKVTGTYETIPMDTWHLK